MSNFTKLLLVFFAMFHVEHAFSQNEIAVGISGSFPEITAWFLAIVTCLMAVCRGVAELLHFISAKTEGKEDDKWAKRVSDWAFWLGKIVGWFGVGTPKLEKKK